MYSVRCSSCGQLVSLKNDEMRSMVDEAEAQNLAHYNMPCPKCRRPVKIQVKELQNRLKLSAGSLPPTAAERKEKGDGE
jgi:phage terminase large subunit GpA-like protein